MMGLRLGLLDPSQVQKWVDEQILKDQDPSDELLDLAFLGTDNVHELISSLRATRDETEDFDVLRKLLSELDGFPFENIDACAKLAKDLYGILCDYDYQCPEDFNFIYHFDDAFDLALRGTWGNPAEVQKDFKDTIESFKITANKRMQADRPTAGR